MFQLCISSGIFCLSEQLVLCVLQAILPLLDCIISISSAFRILVFTNNGHIIEMTLSTRSRQQTFCVLYWHCHKSFYTTCIHIIKVQVLQMSLFLGSQKDLIHNHHFLPKLETSPSCIKTCNVPSLFTKLNISPSIYYDCNKIYIPF